MSDVLPILSSQKMSECSSAQRQEFNDLNECLKKVYDKYTKYKILYESAQECPSSNYLDAELKLKVQDILLEESCTQVLDLDSAGYSRGATSLFGITDSTAVELNYNESINIQKAIESILEEKYSNVCDKFQVITGNNINSVPSALSDFGGLSLNDEDYALLEFKNKLEDQRKKYFQHLLEKQRLLEDIVNLRLKNLPDLLNKKVEEFQIKSQMSDLQSKIVEEKSRVGIFTESVNSLSAFEELIKDIKEQQDECHNDIRYLQQLKKKYEQVACKQYNAILKSYIQYKSSLEKKKMVYDMVQNMSENC